MKWYNWYGYTEIGIFVYGRGNRGKGMQRFEIGNFSVCRFSSELTVLIKYFESVGRFSRKWLLESLKNLRKENIDKKEFGTDEIV